MRRSMAFGLLIALALAAGCARPRLAENRRARSAPPAPPTQPAETPAEPLTPAAPATPAPGVADTSATAVSFEAHVRPILERSCTPCHFTGGQMYERLPFDDPKTVLSRKEGVLRRLKAAADREPFEQWVARQEGSR